MRQQVLDFVLEAATTPRIPLEGRAVEDVVRLMATAIVAVCEKGANDPDGEPPREQQDQE
jgi:hypothetical protein